MEPNDNGSRLGAISGRDYTATRPRGFMDWRPHGQTLVLLGQVREIIAEYAQALTVRQIFYRLVGKYEYEKTEQAYGRLGECLVKARRAAEISWEAIRDDTDVVPAEPGYSGPEEFWTYTTALAEQYERRPVGEVYVEIWTETAGMQPQLEAVADPFGVRVIAGGGFNSVTARYQAAQRLSAIDRPATILLIGDFDPSGQSIMDVSAEDVVAFGVIDATFEHLAVTREQAEFYGLPSKPQKATDKRGAVMEETWQAEALDPAVLAEIVRARLSELVPEAVRDEAARQTTRERRRLLRTLQRMTEE